MGVLLSNPGMSKKKTLNLTVSAELLAEFDQVCRHYGHAKQKGMVLSAAILMFLEADPVAQGECLKEIAVADITSGVREMIRRSHSRQAQADGGRQTETGRAEAADASGSRLAAKEADDSVHVITKLPTLEGLDGSARKQ